MIYERINWQNGTDTPINQTNLNKMDKAISELAGELERLKQLEILSAFPNQSNNCINNCTNFISVEGFSVTYGNLNISDRKLIVANPDYGSTQLKTKLTKNIVLSQDKTLLVKLRIKAVAGSGVTLYPLIGLTDGTSVFLTMNSIVGSNLITNSAYPKYNLPDKKWVDVWYIFGTETETEIESIILQIAPYATVEIASIGAFYSLDKNNTASGTGASFETVACYTMTINRNPTITQISYEEGEI